MEAVMRAGASKRFPEECARQRPSGGRRIIGAGVIANGRKGEVAYIEGLTE
jgi:hypothetical protein